MPARSEAQRRYLNMKFGHDWAKKHGFDNKGKLPAKAKRKKGQPPQRGGPQSTSDRERLSEAFRKHGKKQKARRA